MEFKMKHNVIAYHANCNDGLMAAAIAAKGLAHRNNLADRTQFTFVELDYSPESERNLVKKVIDLAVRSCYQQLEVFILDYCPKKEIIDSLANAVKHYDSINYCYILDHHETACIKELKEKQHVIPGVKYIYNSERSGAGIAWEFFFPSEEVHPIAAAYVQDRDLWQWYYGDDTKKFHAFTRVLPRDPIVWAEKLLTEALTGQLIEAMLDIGADFIKEDAAVKSKIKAASVITEIKVNGAFAPVILCRCDDRKDLVSEICHELITESADPQYKVAICAAQADTGHVVWSVRSVDETPDQICAKEIAVAFGGGGHRNAAGFKTLTFREVITDEQISPSDLIG